MYRVEFTPQADEDISRLDRAIAKRVVDKIGWLSENVEGTVKEPLKGKFKGKYKLRVSDWRVIYSINHSPQVITIYAIEHRSKIYKS